MAPETVGECFISRIELVDKQSDSSETGFGEEATFHGGLHDVRKHTLTTHPVEGAGLYRPLSRPL